LAQAAHRHLRHNGLLLVLFTDRSLSSPFVLELEELLEGAVPGGWQWRGGAGSACEQSLDEGRGNVGGAG